MQVQVKNFGHESAELWSMAQKPSSITGRRIVVLSIGHIPVSGRPPCCGSRLVENASVLVLMQNQEMEQPGE